MQDTISAAIDIGGTFTDTVISISDRPLISAKNPTTPQDPTQGALEGFTTALAQAGIKAGAVSSFIHGTTLATNALIERRGAKTAVVTTRGFRDILEIAYERRYAQYDIMLQKPDLLVPRSRCFTVSERLNVHGDVLQPLDAHSVDTVIDRIQACNVQALAICLLHAYANPIHEIQLRDEIAKRCPGLSISISSEVSPEAREFERLCTTLANAYLQPLMSEYLTRFENAFNKIGLNCPILMMTSAAGMTTMNTARTLPIRLVESGPSGGAVMAARVARQCRQEKVLSFDMGGTTAKLCLINRYTAKTARNFEVNRAARFIKGSGMPVRIPVVEMIEIGAGGGSYAGIDRLKRITIGPQSAGAQPGPAAFDRGGTKATVTDADVVLGYIDPALFAEKRMPLNKSKALDAIDASIARQLGLETQQAAYGISQIVDENMAGAGRMHAVESGINITERTMIAFGGNGPLHATRVARRCGIGKVIIPPNPGVGSAVGFLDAPVSFELVKSHYAKLQQLDTTAISALLASMSDQAHDVVRTAAGTAHLKAQCSAFMRYQGQGHEIEIPLSSTRLATTDLPVLLKKFESEYAFQYSRVVPDMEVEILNWAVKVTSAPGSADAEASPQPHQVARQLRHVNTNQAKPPETTREIVCDLTANVVPAAIYQRQALAPGDTLSGPALIVEPQTTTLVSGDFSAHIDANLNIVMLRQEQTLCN